MRTIRAVSSARARKLRKLGERVWWLPSEYDPDGRGYWTWDMAASRRKRPYCPKMPGRMWWPPPAAPRTPRERPTPHPEDLAMAMRAEKKTFDEIGKALGFTRSRAQQLVKRGTARAGLGTDKAAPGTV